MVQRDAAYQVHHEALERLTRITHCKSKIAKLEAQSMSQLEGMLQTESLFLIWGFFSASES